MVDGRQTDNNLGHTQVLCTHTHALQGLPNFRVFIKVAVPLTFNQSVPLCNPMLSTVINCYHHQQLFHPPLVCLASMHLRPHSGEKPDQIISPAILITMQSTVITIFHSPPHASTFSPLLTNSMPLKCTVEKSQTKSR